MKKILPLIVLLAVASWFTNSALAAITFIQATSSATQTASSITVTPSVAVTSGNLVIIVEGQSSSNTGNTTPTDSAGQTYTLATSSALSAGTGQLSVYYMANSAAIATSSCKFTASDTSASCHLYEFSGVATASPLDSSVINSTTTSVTNATSGALTTTNANDLLFFAVREGANQGNYTAGANFIIPASGTSTRIASQYQVTSTLQSGLVTNMTYSVAGNNETVFTTFKAAAVAGGTPGTAQNIVTNGVVITNGVVFQ